MLSSLNRFRSTSSAWLIPRLAFANTIHRSAARRRTISLFHPKGTLLTGSYAEVHLKVPGQGSKFLIPVNTLIFRSQHLQVGVVRDVRVVLAEFTPGHNFGSEIEIVAGLKADDQVVLNPPDSLVTGQQVQIVNATLPVDTN